MKKLMMNLVLAAAVAGGSGTAFAADCDLALGEKAFRKCKACHKLEEGANGVGPSLFGIVGRTVASVEGFKYSNGMTEYAADGKVWDEAHLQAFLTKPKDEVKGTKMSFAGVRKDEERAALICYLETVK